MISLSPSCNLATIEGPDFADRGRTDGLELAKLLCGLTSLAVAEGTRSVVSTDALACNHSAHAQTERDGSGERWGSAGPMACLRLDILVHREIVGERLQQV